jgi:hypothetical protein
MLRDSFRHGFPELNWQNAKDEARSAVIAAARRRGMITYSDLVRSIRSISLQPHDPRFFHFLGEISSEEDDAGRRLLTVVVVHKHGDMEPGKGLYELAASLGRDTSDLQKCWIEELHSVHRTWSIS